MAPRSPVRRLYDLLVSLDTPKNVHDNLALIHEDYRACVGDPEPRFCEWAYHRLEKRSLVSGLIGAVLRPSDAQKLAVAAGLAEHDVEPLGCEARVRAALNAIGVREPSFPRPLCDGVAELERYRTALDMMLKGIEAPEIEQHGFTPSGERGRRGAERLLKILCFFLWDSGCADAIKRVVTEGRHEFRAAPGVTKWEKWLHDQDLGTFNYLLKALSREVATASPSLPFLRSDQQLWPERAFQSMNSLCDAFKPEVHDAQTGARFEADPRRRIEQQYRAVERVLEDIKSVTAPILRPRVIQFFRRTGDDDSMHHEGYDDSGRLIQFFESPVPYELHRPYLFIAATNPSAVDVRCARMRDEFTRPV